jgi:cytochrome c-type biogenesis protein CcmF
LIAELGHYALVLAFVLSLVQATLPLYGAHRGEARLMAMAPPAAYGQGITCALSFACLVWLYIVSDFSVLNVADNSHTAKPLLYKITGAWGNHEGSMLLWVAVLAGFGALVAAFERRLAADIRARTLAVQGMVAAGFYAFILFTSNPFERLDPAPVDGMDLNPLLQDPGLAFHPPLLYIGYVGLSVAFAFAAGALIAGRVDAVWARAMRPWVLMAWVALTLGIALGSWWAYYELGWGGWWFWDPVENASLMPWLVATALLHSAIVTEKRGALKSWTVLLAVLAFSLSLLGTFLVRSGVLTSVHAFAVDPDRGLFILLLLVLAIGGALTLYAWRAPMLRGGAAFAPISREGALIINNLLLVTAAATVLIGTLYPLALEAVSGVKISVGPPYFNLTFTPLMIPLLLILPVGTLLAWKRGDIAPAMTRLWGAGATALLAAALVLALRGEGPTLAALGFGLGVWLVLGAFADIWSRAGFIRVPFAQAWARLKGLPGQAWGMAVAHAGVGVMVLGITGITAWGTEETVAMRAGDTHIAGPYVVRFEGVSTVQGPNYAADRAEFTVLRDGQRLGTLASERRFYPVARMMTTNVGIRTTGLADLYVALGEEQGSSGPPTAELADGLWAVRLHHNPFAPWIWFGAGIMALGGFVSLCDRRVRIGAPTPSGARRGTQPATATAA